MKRQGSYSRRELVNSEIIQCSLAPAAQAWQAFHPIYHSENLKKAKGNEWFQIDH